MFWFEADWDSIELSKTYINLEVTSTILIFISSFKAFSKSPPASSSFSFVQSPCSSDPLFLALEANPAFKMATGKAETVAVSNQQSGPEPEDLIKEPLAEISANVEEKSEDKKQDKTVDLKLDSRSEDADVSQMVSFLVTSNTNKRSILHQFSSGRHS